jgi:predicted phage terminase large subunit-like protein
MQLALRVEAQADFYFFSRYLFYRRRGYKWLPGPHHRLICDALARVFSGECPRLIINVPPRYSKTELAVINFIAWALGHYPDCEFIHTSYSQRLASHNSWQARELVLHEVYREIFPATRIRRDSLAKHEWRTTAGGCVYAVGAGGTITGYGAGRAREKFSGAIIIDDPHKADEAKSSLMRGNVIEWFQHTLESRKNAPHVPIILIMQRLHEKDLAGWLLNGGNGEAWEHVCLPAIQADGTALWPQKHDLATLHRMRDAAPYVFAGQYMQAPAAPSGNFFKPERMPFIDALPAGASYVRAWDFAATLNGGDWTVGLKLAKLPDGRLVVADVVRFQGDPAEVEAALQHTAQRDGAHTKIRLPQDPGQAGRAQMQRFVRLLAGCNVTAAPVSGGKTTRAEGLAAQVNAGNVLMLKAAWNDKLLDELRLFPNGAHDDQVDAASDAFNELHGGNNGLLDFYRDKNAR